jgi:hypothetical protein
MRAIARCLLAIPAIVMLASQGADPVAAQTREIPKFEVDPSWPKLPSKYVWGQVSSVSIDDRGHAWILQRPTSVRADQRDKAAPPVLEFDEAGNFIQGWGGPGQGYDWPETEHGIYADPKGFIWLGGNGRTDHHLVKFTRDGKFVMQIGRKGQSKGNKDTQNVKQAADTFVHTPTNELFVADGYGNRRIVVFDADTGAFKRMWGAFGNEPLAAASACRCSRSKANTSTRSSSTAIARRRIAATARRLPAPPSRTIPSSASSMSHRAARRACGCSTARRSSRSTRSGATASRPASSMSCIT